MKFLLVLAWIMAPLSTIVCAISIWGHFDYQGSLEQKRHALMGCEASWPYGMPAAIVAIVAWAWIISGGL